MDTNVCKQTSVYLNSATLNFDSLSDEEANINPTIFGENGASIVFTQPKGFGCSACNYAQTDATSSTAVIGQASFLGLMENVVSYPSSVLIPAANQDSKFWGVPRFTFNQGVPNSFASAGGDPQTPAFSDILGSASSATAVDPQYGSVNTVTHVASAGNNNSNRFKIQNFGTTSVTSDWIWSLRLMSNQTCTYTLEDYAINNTITVLPLVAGKWYEFDMIEGALGAGGGPTIIGFPNCATGPTISITGLEVLPKTSGTVDPRGYFGTILSTGAIGGGFGVSQSGGNVIPFENTTLATSSVNQNSPPLYLCDQVWHGGASARDCASLQWTAFNGGADPTMVFNIARPVTGGSGLAVLALSTWGQVNLPGGSFWSGSQVNLRGNTLVVGNNVFGYFPTAFSSVVPSGTGGTNAAGNQEIIGGGTGTGNAVPSLLRLVGPEVSTTSGTGAQTSVNRQVVNDASSQRFPMLILTAFAIRTRSNCYSLAFPSNASPLCSGIVASASRKFITLHGSGHDRINSKRIS